VGMFSSTFISLFLQSVLKTTVTGIIPVLVIILAIGAVLSFINAVKNRKPILEEQNERS
jgi:sorbitol-specific phosphotransferase system component IIC